MKSFIISILFLLMFTLGITAQQKGDLFVGANSELAGSRIVDIGLTPMIGYQVSDNVQVGLHVVSNTTDNTDYNFLQAYLKWYANGADVNDRVRTFFKGQFGTSISDSYTVVSAGAGVTGFLNKWFYLEPSLELSYSDRAGNSTNLGFGVTFGVRL